ncbi:hypothetical protein EVAR_36773_1 [Eumeta japonica]|uniref:Uncharacterized protein n=1 Tax=Eumeta variegata TaxID=151549 RepID=A0A4C1X4D3_EUMVA|nr:hypothetical protein EVAR_36773_1 [Eumeta japonica]
MSTESKNSRRLSDARLCERTNHRPRTAAVVTLQPQISVSSASSVNLHLLPWRRRRRRQFLSPPEEFADPPKVSSSRAAGTSDGGMSDAIGDSAHSRVETCNDAAADDTAKGRATTRDATDCPDLHATSNTDANELELPTARAAGPERMAAGAADRGPPNCHGWPGPNPSSVASTDSYFRRTPVNLRVMYWNAGGKTQDLRTVVQSQDIHIVLLSKTKLRPREELGLPNLFVYRREEVSPGVSHTEVLRYSYGGMSSMEDWSCRTSYTPGH